MLRVKTNELRAAILFASDDETREVLNSVCLECVQGKAPLIVATDGRRIAYIQSESDPCEKTERLIIRSDFIKEYLAMESTNRRGCSGTVIVVNDAIVDFKNDEGHSLHGKMLIGLKYPNWTTILPGEPEKPAAFMVLNGEFLASFARAAKLISDDPFPAMFLRQKDSQSPVEIVFPMVPNFYGLLMGIRHDGIKEWRPDWLK